MPYNVNYTDRENKTPITVYDNTYNTDTSIVIPGRNVAGYGQAIAENLVAMLEHFASANPPPNPIEGQVWFNNTEGISSLQVWDGVSWKSASGIYKTPTKPSTELAKSGELWIDTANNQLHVFTGTDWILIGPEFSTGLKSGLTIERIIDTDDVTRIVLSFYVENRLVSIISKDRFIPKNVISQFPVIYPGINIATPSTGAELNAYTGGAPELHGNATSASNLLIAGTQVSASKFARTDSTNVFERPVTIKNDSGLTVGSNSTFTITTSSTSTKLYNRLPDTPLDIQVINGGLPYTTVRVLNNKVGINTVAPSAEFEVTGKSKLNGKLVITDNTPSSGFTDSALLVEGGVTIGKNLFVDGEISTNSNLTVLNVVPISTDVANLGSQNKRWNKIHVKEVVAETIQGVLAGSISGNANTATTLQQTTTFKLTGDVVSSNVQFNGAEGGTEKTFETTINTDFIAKKPSVSSATVPYSLPDDQVLVFRSSSSTLLKSSRDQFVGDLGVPVGAVFPFAGNTAPAGYLLCDGSEVSIDRYSTLYSIIGSAYNGSAPLTGINTFRLPDLRGRFALGCDIMDNNSTITATSGNIVDAGGGNANRVVGSDSKSVGRSGGSSEYSLAVSNLPDHDHTMQGSSGQQYYGVRADTSVPTDSGAVIGLGGNLPNQVQYLPTSGSVKTTGPLGRPYGVMNPYLTLNYIIRAGVA